MLDNSVQRRDLPLPAEPPIKKGNNVGSRLQTYFFVAVHLYKQSLAVTLRKGNKAAPQKCSAAGHDASADQECGAEDGPAVTMQRSDMALYED